MPPTRRDFLKQSAVAAGVAAAAPSVLAATARRGPRPPPHAPLAVPGVHVYADAESVRPGEVIRFHVSADAAYTAELCRLGLEVDDPAGDEVLHRFKPAAPRVQPIHPGSYVHVPRGLRGELRAFTAEAWVRPWRVDRLQGVASQEDKQDARGWALGLGADGYVGFYLGDGVSPDDRLVHRAPAGVVQKGRWQHLVGRWDGTMKEVFVDGRRVAAWPFAGPLRPGPHPIRLGAMGDEGRAVRFLDGDLAMVALYDAAMGDEQIAARFSERGLHRAAGILPAARRMHGEGAGKMPAARSLLACWDFSEERGEDVADVSGRQRHGRIVNRATWMIGGPSFDPDVARFGDYDPARDPRRGHGLRLASDDLYDCGWEATHRWCVPADARSGFYVLRLRHEKGGQEFLQHAMFVVRRPARLKPSPIVLLAATNTWRAYNAAAFGVPRPGARQLAGTDGFPNSPGDPPAFSFYRPHAAGQGTYQLGRLVPWPAAGPYLRYGDATEYSHLARADRFTQVWLEREGCDYEVVSDHDLHRDPGLLRRCRVFLINGHSEYWSAEMYHGLEEFLRSGGKAVVLSGNSLFWRVTYSGDGVVMECRKVDAPGEQMRPELRGEAWHSHDGRRGGMMRECGLPGWRLIGLETLGWNNQGNPKNFGPWIAEAVDHPVFHTPEETGLKPGDRFGWTGRADRTPMANGHEFDIRLSTLAKLAAGPSPPGAVMPEDPPGIRRLANGVIPWQHGGAAFDYFFRPIRPADEQGGEMIWWERPDGGAVFNAGTIGAGWALHADPKWAALLRNVLHHFGVGRGL